MDEITWKKEIISYLDSFLFSHFAGLKVNRQIEKKFEKYMDGKVTAKLSKVSKTQFILQILDKETGFEISTNIFTDAENRFQGNELNNTLNQLKGIKDILTGKKVRL